MEVSISKAKESVHRVYGKALVDWHFYYSSLFEIYFIVFVTIFFILKHPNKSLFNPIKYIFDIFYTHSILLFL